MTIKSDPNGIDIATERPSDLDALNAKLQAAKARRPQDKAPSSNGNALGMAWRLSTELIVSVLVGTGLGYGLDKFFETSPWILLVGMGFGFAAGIKAVLRTADRMDAADANIPLGTDLPDALENEDDL
ncbi:ATP synthase protein I [Litorimonas taeanensis]|uniref:ATP synthase protein I n=1 Tax=Litorimonas taeanensis TaxID=568099 RepID=A0A420WJ68_9PROT|nr:AtpZ/AtpI family protein [Litorimonas taeanensis]RKQ70972.1 ATP synthase protein I [Litorimonas taeanensis]